METNTTSKNEIISVDYTMVHGHICSSGNPDIDIETWDDSSMVDRILKDKENCKRICNGRAECTAFDHDTATDTCRLWKHTPSLPQPRSGYNCYQKITGKNTYLLKVM